MRKFLAILFRGTLVTLSAPLVASSCFAANSMGFDLGPNIRANYTSVQSPFDSRSLGDQMRPNMRPSMRPIVDRLIEQMPVPVPVEDVVSTLGLSSSYLPDARTNLMAPQSVDMSPVPSASFNYGFADSGSVPYRGVTFSRSAAPSFGGILPPCATSSVDLNIVDGPTRGSGGNSIGGGGGSGGGSPEQPPSTQMPILPPGWIGVQNSHSGAYMGAIPPGGTLEAFFRGEYGIVPGQEAEARWILENQLPRLRGGP